MNDYLYYIPGFCQGLTRVVISYPFDYFRIFKQTNTSFSYVTEISRLKFYKGVGMPIITVPLDRAFTFNLYEKLKNKGFSNIECSLYPSIISSIYMTPLSVITTNYIYIKDSSMMSVISYNFNKNMFRGMGIELLRNNLSGVVFLFTYKNLSSISNYPFINGSVSSFIMWSLLYPLDTIKVRKFISHTNYIEIVKKNSFRSLYNGIGLVYMKTIPSAGIGMVVYENVKKKIDNLK